MLRRISFGRVIVSSLHIALTTFILSSIIAFGLHARTAWAHTLAPGVRKISITGLPGVPPGWVKAPVLSANGHTLYVLDTGETGDAVHAPRPADDVVAINLKTGKLAKPPLKIGPSFGQGTDLPKGDLSLDPLNHRLYAINGSGAIVTINTRQWKIVGKKSASSLKMDPIGIVVDAPADLLWMVDAGVAWDLAPVVGFGLNKHAWKPIIKFPHDSAYAGKPEIGPNGTAYFVGSQWNGPGGMLIVRYDPKAPHPEQSHRIKRPFGIWTVLPSNDGRFIYLIGGKDRVKASNGKPEDHVEKINRKTQKILLSRARKLYSSGDPSCSNGGFAISPSGKFIVIASSKIQIISTATLETVASFGSPGPSSYPGCYTFIRSIISTSGNKLYLVGNKVGDGSKSALFVISLSGLRVN